MSAQTVTGFELLGVDPKLSTLNKWYRALEGAGVEFIDGSIEDDRGPGVRLRYSGKPAQRQARRQEEVICMAIRGTSHG